MNILLRMIFSFGVLFTVPSSNFAFATAIAVEDIVSVVPSVATIGTPVVITGVGFGTKKGSAFLTSMNTGTKKYSIKIFTWSDTQIAGTVSAGVLGKFDINVITKDKKIVIEPAALTIDPPTITTVTPSTAAVGSAVTISGSLFGYKKGKFLINGGSFPVKSWTDTTITFVVSSKLPNGPKDITVKSQAGTTTNTAALIVTGSTQPIGKDGLKAIVEGVPFAASGAKLVGQNAITDGKTVFTGVQGKNIDNYDTALSGDFLFVPGVTPVPHTITDFSGFSGNSFFYQVLTPGNPNHNVRNFMAFAGTGFTLTIDNVSGNQIHATFSGNLKDPIFNTSINITNGEVIVTLKPKL